MNKMRSVYPIVLTPTKYGFSVYMPDFEKNTQGKDIIEALDMAQDAIEMMGVFWQDEGREIPAPSSVKDVKSGDDDIVTLVTADFDAYRRKMETRVVRKSIALPSWLNEEAENAGVNFSQTLQEALKARLNL
jgi:predicted RNase H-like HicB family nuclease